MANSVRLVDAPYRIPAAFRCLPASRSRTAGAKGRKHRCRNPTPRNKEMAPRVLISEPADQRSEGGIADEPRNAVEIGVVTGEMGQTMGLHDRDDQGVSGKKLELPAHQGRGLHERVSHGD